MENNIGQFASDNQGAVNRIRAQALAIRALAHFDLLRYFVEAYDRNSAKPGVPYITVFDYEQKPGRGTVKDTYDHIEQDLKTAKSLMALWIMPSIREGNKAYIDANAINAMARMYLYSNQLDSAIKYSGLVIGARPLAPRVVFPDIWTDASTAEVVWSCVFETGQGTPGGNVYFPVAPAGSGRGEYKPNPTLLSTYDQANDIRYASYFQVIAGRLVLSKYLAKDAQLSKPDGVVNFKAFRTGEMYLIRAEAYARKGAASEAASLADLNALRGARINGYTPMALTGLQQLPPLNWREEKN